MKFILATLLLVIANSALAGIHQDISALGKLAFGSDVTAVQGTTAEELFKAYLNEGEELVFKGIDDMDYGDDVDEGFTSLASARQMNSFAEIVYDEQLENADGAARTRIQREVTKLKREWAPLINKLHQQGVKFGYTGHGPGYCGVSFIEMIAVDVKAKKVYQVYLSEGGDCK